MFIEYRGKTPRVAATAFVAPTAVLVGDVIVGDESSIWFGVVIRADRGAVRIGARSAIEDNAVVHATDDRTTTIGDDVTVGHGTVLDDCTIEDGALVGSNAVVLGGALVGRQSVIGAGAVVAADTRVPPSVVAAGAPAKVRKAVAGRAAAWIAQSTGASLAQAHDYRRDNIGDPQHHEIKTTSRRRRGAVLA
ncbi:MAG: gamma carbonic anhydrase family protein [Vulcanimicrobiaceae bacterium]